MQLVENVNMTQTRYEGQLMYYDYTTKSREPVFTVRNGSDH